MAYGNLPGGGYSGFLKAESPLPIKERSYIPVKDDWPPKYGSYGEESKALVKDKGIPEVQKDVLQDPKAKGISKVSKHAKRERKRDDVSMERNKIIKQTKPKQTDRITTGKPKRGKSVTFDDENLEQYQEDSGVDDRIRYKTKETEISGKKLAEEEPGGVSKKETRKINAIKKDGKKDTDSETYPKADFTKDFDMTEKGDKDKHSEDDSRIPFEKKETGQKFRKDVTLDDDYRSEYPEIKEKKETADRKDRREIPSPEEVPEIFVPKKVAQDDDYRPEYPKKKEKRMVEDRKERIEKPSSEKTPEIYVPRKAKQGDGSQQEYPKVKEKRMAKDRVEKQGKPPSENIPIRSLPKKSPADDDYRQEYPKIKEKRMAKYREEKPRKPPSENIPVRSLPKKSTADDDYRQEYPKSKAKTMVEDKKERREKLTSDEMPEVSAPKKVIRNDIHPERDSEITGDEKRKEGDDKISFKSKSKMKEKDERESSTPEKEKARIPEVPKEESILDETEEEERQDEVIINIPEDEESAPEFSEDDEEDIYVKFRRRRKVPTYTYFKRKRSLLRFCPCLDQLLHSKRLEYRGLKAMLGFPIGALFGFALYWIVLVRMGAGRNYFWVLGICFGIGFSVSTQVRCICLLSIPTCCGRAGRAFISTYAVAYVIEGPFANILTNAKESMRSISCTASLNLNHSMERFHLMFKPVKEIVLDFVGAGDKVQEDAKQLEKTFTNIEEEVQDENEIRESMADVDQLDKEIGVESRSDIIKRKFKKRLRPTFGEDSEKKYGMKSEFRCEEIFSKGVRGCYNSFGKAYDRCLSYLPIIGYLLCWPMKLTFICDIASSLMGKRSCDSDDVMNPGFGASVDTADAVQSEFDKDFAVQLQYKLIIPEQRIDQLVPEDISGAMRHSFERRKKNLDFFTQLVDRILAALIFLVLNASRKYCNQYLRIIQFDNKYVTSYFRHIDARRRKDGKTVLLPLKKAEKLELFDPFSVKLSPEEKMKLIVGGLRLASEVFTVTILLLFDRIFYELLDVIKRHAHVTYKQTGVHHIKMTIYGDGFVGNMVRGILKGFDKKHTADQVTTTEACLPLPTKLPREMIIRLYSVFLILLVLMILESYALRLRRVICSFYYPKREKRRIIFLYNDRMKKRRSFLQHMRHRVRKQAREQAIAIDSGVFFSLRLFYPKYFSWLAKLGLGLAKCLICNETESKKCSLVACPECPFTYCSECWHDTEGKCYACLPDYDTDPTEDSASE